MFSVRLGKKPRSGDSVKASEKPPYLQMKEKHQMQKKSNVPGNKMEEEGTTWRL